MKAKIIILLLFFPVLLYSQNPDIQILKEININRNTSLDSTFRLLTDSAAPLAFGITALLLVLAFIRKDLQKKQRAIIIGTSVVSSAIISLILKFIIDRPRPFDVYPFIEKMAGGGSPSFPSGHTSDAFALATSLSLVYPKWYIVIPSYMWALGVSYSRLHLGVHFPTDVLVGVIIGLGIAYLNFWAIKKVKIKI